jgi:hypothetical protein
VRTSLSAAVEPESWNCPCCASLSIRTVERCDRCSPLPGDGAACEAPAQ